VECFLAAAAVGPTGRVYGIDMTDAMLDLARKSKRDVVKDLGYDTIEFRKGYLEEIPLDDASADVVISNCVINLSPDKRKTYLEILRVLKPGGRLVVADVVTDGPVSAAVRNSRKYRGECLGGAMQQDDLIAMLEDCGFASVYLHKRLPYREVDGNRFYSLTYAAGKAAVIDEKRQVRCIYRGPSPILETASGERLERGRTVELPAETATSLGEQVFLLDDAGTVLNVEQDSCCCAAPETEQQEKKVSAPVTPVNLLSRHLSDCMVCGGELEYLNDREEEKSCHFCGCSRMTGCFCMNGHFICDACHQQGGIDVVRNICLNSEEKDLLGLFRLIRSHPAVPMHGPEHHSMVPGIILTAYRNNGGRIARDVIATGIDRGSNVPGGTCGFWGTCGAAVGAGIAASLILEATPLTPDARQSALTFTAKILIEIAKINGARCCQRESWLALTLVARLSGEFFGIELPANRAVRCSQYQTNRECIRTHCPLWETRDWAGSGKK
jgi:SAM-dependent methyltransferase